MHAPRTPSKVGSSQGPAAVTTSNAPPSRCIGTASTWLPPVTLRSEGPATGVASAAGEQVLGSPRRARKRAWRRCLQRPSAGGTREQSGHDAYILTPLPRSWGLSQRPAKSFAYARSRTQPAEFKLQGIRVGTRRRPCSYLLRAAPGSTTQVGETWRGSGTGHYVQLVGDHAELSATFRLLAIMSSSAR